MKTKYYVVFRRDYNGFFGYTTNKEYIEMFKKQRDMRYYNIHTFSKKNVPPHILDMIKESFRELSYVTGFIISPSEEDYVIAAKDEYIIETITSIKSMIETFIPFIKFEDKHERTVVVKGIMSIMGQIRLYRDFVDDNDDLDGEMEIIDLDALTRRLIKSVMEELI